MFLINNNEKISRREHELAEIDGRHKILEPMDYGFELIPGVHDESASPEDIEKLKKESGHFFKNSLVTDFREEGSELSFTSNEKTEINENNTVHGVFFERKGAGKALILLPNWNADGPSFDTLARLYSLANYSCLRLSLPYHDDRKPPDWPIAKYMVSANIGRTISAIRQAVLDVRCSIDWLVSRNYTSIGIVGISIGSCIATLTAAHDSRVNVIVQTLMASNFAEAVWSGIATKHIRQSFDNNISLEQLKKYWAVISPDEYFHFLKENQTKILMITGALDPVFIPKLADDTADHYRENRIEYEWYKLPCGHYTLADFPYSYQAFIKSCFWLRKNL